MAEAIAVREILRSWLEAYGYDGLYTRGCGCVLSDLIPCGADPSSCKPGKSYQCRCGDHVVAARGLNEPLCEVCSEW